MMCKRKDASAYSYCIDLICLGFFLQPLDLVPFQVADTKIKQLTDELESIRQTEEINANNLSNLRRQVSKGRSCAYQDPLSFNALLREGAIELNIVIFHDYANVDSSKNWRRILVTGL